MKFYTEKMWFGCEDQSKDWFKVFCMSLFGSEWELFKVRIN